MVPANKNGADVRPNVTLVNRRTLRFSSDSGLFTS